MKSLRLPLSVSVSFLSLVVPVTALGASLTIQQKGESGITSSWRMIDPHNKEIIGSKEQTARTFEDIIEGTYSLQVNSPQLAKTTIDVYRNAQLLESISGRSATFFVRDFDALRVVITQSFEGTIVVKSSRPGASFVLTGPNDLRKIGTTPASFSGLQPAYYTIHYGLVEGCNPPKQQKRDLISSGVLDFYGEYTCSVTMTSKKPTIPTSTQEEEQKENMIQAVEISHHVTNAEVLPGDSIEVFVTLKNSTKSTLRNLTLTEAIPENVTVLYPILDNGVLVDTTIQWNVPPVFAGKTWTASYKAKVADDLQMGETMILSGHIEGSDLEYAEVTERSDSVTVGRVVIPQTGMRIDILFLITSALLAYSFVHVLRRSNA